MPSSGSGTVTPVVPVGPVPPSGGASYGESCTFPIELWREYFGFRPWQFQNLRGQGTPDDGCADTVKQYAWQAANKPSRDDIKRAICNAVSTLADAMQFSPVVHFANDSVAFPRFYNHSLVSLSSADANGRWMAVRASEGYLRKMGVEAYSTLALALPIAITDSDSDGVLDTFTSDAFATSLTGVQVDEIEAYFASVNRLDNEPIGERWRIAPTSVTVNAGLGIIRGRAWLVTKPILQQSASGLALDVATTSNYVSTIDVYRHYADPTGITSDTVQSVLTWESGPFPSGCCGDSSLTFTDAAGDPAAYASAYARAGIRESKLGLVYLGEAVYDSSTGYWGSVSWSGCRPPDNVLLRYQAGYPLAMGSYASAPYRNGRVDERMVRMVCMLSAAMLGRPIDACSVSNRLLTDMQFDLARSSGANDESYGITTREMLNCPWGTRRGAILAWKETDGYEVGHGLAL